MDLNEAEKMCRRLMDDHGLHHVPLVMRNMKRTLGHCKFSKYTYLGQWRKHQILEIALSKTFITHNDVAQVKDTILHEIAHALDPNMGHGPTWRAMARRVGAVPKPCAGSEVTMPEGAWVGTCDCGFRTHQHRAPLRVKSCPKHGGFSPRHLLTWTKNGRKVSFDGMPERYRAESVRLEMKYSVVVPQRRA